MYRVVYALLQKMKHQLLTQCQGRANFLALAQQLSMQIVDDNALLKTAFSLRLKRSDFRQSTATQFVPDPAVPVYYRPKVDQPPKLFREDDVLTTHTTTTRLLLSPFSFSPGSLGQLEVMYEWLPTRVRILDLVKVFDADVDGYSFLTFISTMEALDESLLVLKTSEGQIFGIFVNVPWRKSPGFIGSQECILFTLQPEIHGYSWVEHAEQERKFLHVDDTAFHFGMSQTGTALSVDEDWTARSDACSMFNSPALIAGESVDIVKIEVFEFLGS